MNLSLDMDYYAKLYISSSSLNSGQQIPSPFT